MKYIFSLNTENANFKKGFTLLELLISLAVLSILMLATSSIFVRSFGSYQGTKRIESNISDAQFLMNSIAKELRTSTVVAPTSDGSTQSLKFFEYSKSECIQYRFNSGTIEVARSSSGSTFESCNNTANLSGFSRVGIGSISGSFYSLPSKPVSPGPQRVGRVTVTLSIQVSGSDPVVLQSTTSLRDYGYAGLQ